MKAIKTERLDITISAKEIKEIVRSYLTEKKGIAVDTNEMRFSIKTVYDGSLNDPGSDEVQGIEISSTQNQKHLDI